MCSGEADDRIMFRVNVVIVDKFSNAQIHILFQYQYFSMYAVHFNHWMYFGLNKFLINNGKHEIKEVTPLHKNIKGMDSNFQQVAMKRARLAKSSYPSSYCKMGLQFIIFIWKIIDI